MRRHGGRFSPPTRSMTPGRSASPRRRSRERGILFTNPPPYEDSANNRLRPPYNEGLPKIAAAEWPAAGKPVGDRGLLTGPPRLTVDPSQRLPWVARTHETSGFDRYGLWQGVGKPIDASFRIVDQSDRDFRAGSASIFSSVWPRSEVCGNHLIPDTPAAARGHRQSGTTSCSASKVGSIRS
jgi:hypothetical protein